VNRARAARLLVLALASSSGVHAALAPTHAAESPLLGALFALSALGSAFACCTPQRAASRRAPPYEKELAHE
jgi:hypothetical protein